MLTQHTYRETIPAATTTAPVNAPATTTPAPEVVGQPAPTDVSAPPTTYFYTTTDADGEHGSMLS